jgi:hypothetical protein
MSIFGRFFGKNPPEGNKGQSGTEKEMAVPPKGGGNGYNFKWYDPGPEKSVWYPGSRLPSTHLACCCHNQRQGHCRTLQFFASQ